MGGVMRYKNEMAGIAVLVFGLLFSISGQCKEAKTEAPSLTSPWPKGFPAGLPAPELSGRIPFAVPAYPKTLTAEQARTFFDYYTWQSFIAFMWPANQATTAVRGSALEPDKASVFKKAGNGYPLVWRQYKEYFELLGTGNVRPTAWSSYDVPPAAQVCPGAPATSNQPQNILNVINQAMSVPLIDQNKNYTFSEVRFNDVQYNFIRGDDATPASWLYLKKNLPTPPAIVNMPPGRQGDPETMTSIMLKGTWRVMTDAEMKNPAITSRYYIVKADLLQPQQDATKNFCLFNQYVGLVGFHVTVKLADYPQWIWATVAQVDNVKLGHGAPRGIKPSFNNGTNSPATPKGWANKPAQKVPPLVPFEDRIPGQITQLNPTPDSTQAMNQVYQKLLKGTVWENYEVLITQYPFTPGTFKTIEAGGIYPRDSGGAWAPNGAVNPVMESYVQSNEDASGNQGNSCMKCHYEAGNTDYSWLLKTGSH